MQSRRTLPRTITPVRYIVLLTFCTLLGFLTHWSVAMLTCTVYLHRKCKQLRIALELTPQQLGLDDAHSYDWVGLDRQHTHILNAMDLSPGGLLDISSEQDTVFQSDPYSLQPDDPVFHPIDESDDYSSHYDNQMFDDDSAINPATGEIMIGGMGGIDTGGDVFGSSFIHDMHDGHDTSFDSFSGGHSDDWP
jgi:hypothetical protein